MCFRFSLFATVLLSVGTTLAQQAPTYTIRQGDTLFHIAQQLGIPVDTLHVLNGHRTAPLEPGQTLQLPAQFATVPYRVCRGDTLFRISTQHGITVEALRRINDLHNDRIVVDQVLKVPSHEGAFLQTNTSLPSVFAEGTVWVYPETFTGRLTASGTPYDPTQFSVSHAHLPLGTVVLLTNPTTDQRTFAEVKDRRLVSATYLMDVSAAVARQLGLETDQQEAIELRVVQ